MEDRTPEKKDKLLAALERGMVMIHLDARRPGVAVPTHFRGEAHLRLNLSYRFDPPDLSVGEWGVRSTLSFSGSRFTVAVPWSALFAITSHVSQEFWMFPDDMPAELLGQSVGPDGEPAREQSAPPERGGRPRAVLREVRNEPDPAPAAPEPAAALPPPPAPAPAPVQTTGDDEPPKPKGRGHLRLVK